MLFFKQWHYVSTNKYITLSLLKVEQRKVIKKNLLSTHFLPKHMHTWQESQWVMVLVVLILDKHY